MEIFVSYHLTYCFLFIKIINDLNLLFEYLMVCRVFFFRQEVLKQNR